RNYRFTRQWLIRCELQKNNASTIHNISSEKAKNWRSCHNERHFFNVVANSDDCFLEFTDFVLEGTALAIETTITSQECKCRCLKGESLYGEACQSFEYYFDSNTCLINKQNRFSSPESFNFVSSAQPRSYFEHKCATRVVGNDKLHKQPEITNSQGA
ncbi:PAN domain protein, partial [Ancylostoma duodenale]